MEEAQGLDQWRRFILVTSDIRLLQHIAINGNTTRYGLVKHNQIILIFKYFKNSSGCLFIALNLRLFRKHAGNQWAVRFEVFTAVRMNITVFWDATPCSYIEGYRHLEETCCLHVQSIDIKYRN